jgi:hypothetical protein
MLLEMSVKCDRHPPGHKILCNDLLKSLDGLLCTNLYTHRWVRMNLVGSHGQLDTPIH